MLELEPVGRHTIYMCTNISCQLRGAQDVLAALSEATGSPVGGSSPDGEFRLRSFECLGACDIAPMASIEGHYRGPLTPEDAHGDRRAPARGRRRGGRAARQATSATTGAARGGAGAMAMSRASCSSTSTCRTCTGIETYERARRLPRRCAGR